MANSPKWVPAAPALQEAPDSGAIDTTGNGTLTKIYSGKYADCKAAALNPGTAGSGETAGLLCRNSLVTKAPRGIGRLTIIWEGYTFGGGGGTQLPAESYGLAPFDAHPPIECNPKYATVAASPSVLSKVRAAGILADDDKSSTAYAALSGNALALKLADLMREGVQTYYDAGFRLWWIWYSLTSPTLSRGGFTESPGSPIGSLAVLSGLKCIREADQLDVEQGFYKVTSTWLCLPNGTWRADVYDP